MTTAHRPPVGEESSSGSESAVIRLSSSALKRVQELLSEEGNEQLMLRVYIRGGGCAGFQYGFAFDETQRPDDLVVTEKCLTDDQRELTISVVVDALSQLYLTGAQIDYQESLQGAYFTVKNPNAQTTCSCGASFALSDEPEQGSEV